LIKTKINREKNYLTYFISDKTCGVISDTEVKVLAPILKLVQALLWMHTSQQGKCMLIAV
jgi:hypothetical protein